MPEKVKVLYTIESINIRESPGGDKVVAILSDEILLTIPSSPIKRVIDSESVEQEWINIRYYNQKDEAHPENMGWIEGWVVKDFTKNMPEKEPGKSDLSTSETQLSQAEMLIEARYIYRYLSERGWTDNAIYAILGNMEKESTINHMRREVKGRNAIGLVQWTPPEKLYDWVYEKTLKKENNDIDMQLERIIYESTQGDLQWSINEHPANISFAEFVHSTEEPGKLAEVFYMCYEQFSEELQPERGKWAEKWKEILEILNC